MKVERLDKDKAEKVLTLGDLPGGTVFEFLDAKPEYRETGPCLKGYDGHKVVIFLGSDNANGYYDDQSYAVSPGFWTHALRPVRILNVKLVVLP